MSDRKFTAELCIPCSICGAAKGELCVTAMAEANPALAEHCFHGARGWESNPHLLVNQLLELPLGNLLHCDSYTTDNQKVLHIWDDAGHSYDLTCYLNQISASEAALAKAEAPNE